MYIFVNTLQTMMFLLVTTAVRNPISVTCMRCTDHLLHVKDILKSNQVIHIYKCTVRNVINVTCMSCTDHLLHVKDILRSNQVIHIDKYTVRNVINVT